MHVGRKEPCIQELHMIPYLSSLHRDAIQVSGERQMHPAERRPFTFETCVVSYSRQSGHRTCP